MIEVNRIVEHQANLSSYRATQDEERAVQLELLIEMTKPKNLYHEWHALIATPFRYNPPHPIARFRPPFTKRNIFYGSALEETALYEYTYNFMKQRIHLKEETETGIRTSFTVNADDKKAFHLNQLPMCNEIMNKNNYFASHQFIEDHPEVDFIIYPSCRDPERRDNVAILNISFLEKNLGKERSLKYFYDYKNKNLCWINERIKINWSDVS